jgi:hypothetical protein
MKIGKKTPNQKERKYGKTPNLKKQEGSMVKHQIKEKEKKKYGQKAPNQEKKRKKIAASIPSPLSFPSFSYIY